MRSIRVIKVPVNYYLKGKKKVYDYEGMREEFEWKMRDLK